MKDHATHIWEMYRVMAQVAAAAPWHVRSTLKSAAG